MFEVQFFVFGLLSFAKIVKFEKISTPKVSRIQHINYPYTSKKIQHQPSKRKGKHEVALTYLLIPRQYSIVNVFIF